ncbi:hypothetical protein PRIPAC_96194 [Pristionchus pacificus]|uniref:Uncharacterized protein n=1 Tax=Pristionchus pacificus TaxID=54126 RepID=A0A2A6CH19_PRIPA|nr:hypothetical protein PRIPAC_96194 [Pristionchus pacificus]|eukprot:PDM77387.1 hypothetical protein PRIPAC_33117 [Pristionchus pacificus]
MRVLQCRSRPRDVQLSQMLAHKRMIHQPANRVLNGVMVTQEEWDWVDVTALKKNTSCDVIVRVDWGPDWSDEKGCHETWEPIECIPASEEVFIDLVKEKMEEDPDFFDDVDVIEQFIKIGLDLFKFGEVELAPWLIEKKNRFLETLSEEDRAYKLEIDEAIKQRRRAAVAEKKRLSNATKARAAEARKTRQTVKAIDLAGKKASGVEKRKTRQTIKKLTTKRATVAEKKKAEKAQEKEKKKEKKMQEALAKKAERERKAATAEAKKASATQISLPQAPQIQLSTQTVVSSFPQSNQAALSPSLYQPITPPLAHSPSACLFDQSLPQYQSFHPNQCPQSSQYPHPFPNLDFPFVTPSVTPDEVFDPPF